MFVRILKQCSCRNFSKSTTWRNSDQLKPVDPPASSKKNEGIEGISSSAVTKNWEKRLLVFSGKYKSLEEVPNRVSSDSINKAKSIMRIKVGNLMMLGVVIACFMVVYYGKQRAKAGDSITRRQLEKDEKIKAEGRLA